MANKGGNLLQDIGMLVAPQTTMGLMTAPLLRQEIAQKQDQGNALQQLIGAITQGKMPTQDLNVSGVGPAIPANLTMGRQMDPYAALIANRGAMSGTPAQSSMANFLRDQAPGLIMRADPQKTLGALQASLIDVPQQVKLTPGETFGVYTRAGGFKPGYTAPQAPPEFLRGLSAIGIVPGDPRYDKAVEAWANKQTGQDPLTMSEIARNRATTANAGLVETKDAFGNPIIINKGTGAVTNPAGGVQTIGPEDVQSTATAIANYKRRPPTGAAARSPFWLSVMDEAMKINPDYNEQFYNSSNAARTKFSSGKEGSLVRSANVATSHLETLDALGRALDNGDVKLANELKNKLSDQFGGVPISGYEAAAPLVGDEVAKFILGGNSALADREKFAAPLSSARSGPSRSAAINSFRGLMVGQLHGLKRQYETETKSKDFGDKLDPDVAKLLENPQYAPGMNPNAAPALKPGDVVQSLPPGAKMLPDGRAQLPDGTILRPQ